MRRAACVMALLTTLCGCESSPQLPNDTIEIKTLTVAQAKALAQHKGDLLVNGLTTISDEAAKALAQHKGMLVLNGLTTLSDEAAKALAQHEGGLFLFGLSSLSDEAAKALGANSDIFLPPKFRFLR